MRPAGVLRRPIPLLLAGLLILAGCGPDPLDPGEQGPLAGDWTYRGGREHPLVRELSGGIRIDSHVGSSLTGSATVSEEGGALGPRRVDGFLTGEARAGGEVVFDVRGGGGIWVHIGRAEGDSVWGEWLDEAGNGTFVMRRALERVDGG